MCMASWYASIQNVSLFASNVWSRLKHYKHYTNSGCIISMTHVAMQQHSNNPERNNVLLIST